MQLQPQVLARVHVQRPVLGDREHLTVVGLEPERRVVHGVAVDGADADGLAVGVPLGRGHRAADDAGVRLGDVLHGRRALELLGTVDLPGDVGRGRRGTAQQNADHHRDDRDQDQHEDALSRQEPRVETVGAVVARGCHAIS